MDCDGTLTMTIGSGVLDVNGEFEVSSSSGGHKNQGTIYVAGDFDASTANNTDFGPYGTHTTVLDGSDQNINLISSGTPVYFNNLTSDASSTVTLLANNLSVTNDFEVSDGTFEMSNLNMDINDDFTVNTGGTFNSGTGSHTVAGNWNCSNGTFNSSTGQITLDAGSSGKTINQGSSNSFNNLIIYDYSGML